MYISLNLSIYLLYLSVRLFLQFFLSFYLFIHPPFYLSIYLYTYLLYQCIDLSICVSIYLPACISIYLSICMSLYLSHTLCFPPYLTPIITHPTNQSLTDKTTISISCCAAWPISLLSPCEEHALLE